MTLGRLSSRRSQARHVYAEHAESLPERSDGHEIQGSENNLDKVSFWPKDRDCHRGDDGTCPLERGACITLPERGVEPHA